jgi:O-antigen/teichoic acid export membrane protein
MTLRQLARGSVLYAVGQLLPRISLLILVPVYVRYMTPAEFGVMMLTVSIGSMLGILFRFGLDGSVLRIHFDLAPPERGTLYWTAAAISVLGSAAVMLVVTPLAIPTFSRVFVGTELWPYGALAAALGFTNGLQFVPSVWFRASERPLRYIAYTAAVFAVTFLASLFLLVVVGLGPVGALLGWIAGGIVTIVVAAGVLAGVGPPHFDRTVARASLSYGLPLIPHSLSAWVLNVSDRLLIGLLVGLPAIGAQAAIGRYTLGYQLAYMISLLAIAAQYALSPYLFRVAGTPAGPRLHREVVTVGMAVFLVLAAAEVASAPEIIGILAPGDEYRESVNVLRIVPVGASLFGLYALVVPILLYAKRTGVLALMTTASAVVNVAANIVLIPRIGIVGAAVATVASYGAYLGMTIVVTRRAYPLDLDARRIGVLWAAAMLLVGAPAAMAGAGSASAIIRALACSAFILLAAAMAWGAARRARVIEAGVGFES